MLLAATVGVVNVVVILVVLEVMTEGILKEVVGAGLKFGNKFSSCIKFPYAGALSYCSTLSFEIVCELNHIKIYEWKEKKVRNTTPHYFPLLKAQ